MSSSAINSGSLLAYLREQDLDLVEFGVAAAIVSFFNFDPDSDYKYAAATVRHDKLANCVKRSPSSLRRAIYRLVEAGVVVVEHNARWDGSQAANSYSFPGFSGWRSEKLRKAPAKASGIHINPSANPVADIGEPLSDAEPKSVPLSPGANTKPDKQAVGPNEGCSFMNRGGEHQRTPLFTTTNQYLYTNTFPQNNKKEGWIDLSQERSHPSDWIVLLIRETLKKLGAAAHCPRLVWRHFCEFNAMKATIHINALAGFLAVYRGKLDFNGDKVPKFVGSTTTGNAGKDTGARTSAPCPHQIRRSNLAPFSNRDFQKSDLIRRIGQVVWDERIAEALSLPHCANRFTAQWDVLATAVELGEINS